MRGASTQCGCEETPLSTWMDVSAYRELTERLWVGPCWENILNQLNGGDLFHLRQLFP